MGVKIKDKAFLQELHSTEARRAFLEANLLPNVGQNLSISLQEGVDLAQMSQFILGFLLVMHAAAGVVAELFVAAAAQRFLAGEAGFGTHKKENPRKAGVPSIRRSVLLVCVLQKMQIRLRCGRSNRPRGWSIRFRCRTNLQLWQCCQLPWSSQSRKCKSAGFQRCQCSRWGRCNIP